MLSPLVQLTSVGVGEGERSVVDPLWACGSSGKDMFGLLCSGLSSSSLLLCSSCSCCSSHGEVLSLSLLAEADVSEYCSKPDGLPSRNSSSTPRLCDIGFRMPSKSPLDV